MADKSVVDKDFAKLAKRRKDESDEDYVKRLKDLLSGYKDELEYREDIEGRLRPGEFKTKKGEGSTYKHQERRYEQDVKSGGAVNKNYAYGGRVAKMSAEKS